MQIWTLAYHNRTGTGAIVFTGETETYLSLVNIVVDPSDSDSLLAAKKMLFLRQLEELCTYLQRNHFGEWDDYCIQAHTLNIAINFPEEPK